MAYTDNKNVVVTNPLLKAGKPSKVDGAKTRLYRGVFESRLSESRITGNVPVYWRLRRRSFNYDRDAAQMRAISMRNHRMPVDLYERIRSQFSDRLSQSANMLSSATCDFRALIQWGACVMSQYSMTGYINWDIVTNGTIPHPVSVIQTTGNLRFIDPGQLYLMASLHASQPYTFAALYALCVATGADVVMDSVGGLNTANNFEFPALSENTLAREVNNAVFYLCKLMDSMGAGADAALALVTGAHLPTTVVGHSDEGGIMRDVLRSIDFPTPCGYIGDLKYDNVLGPLWRIEDLCPFETLTAAWDYVALASAALVHVSDPGIDIKDELRPTIATAPYGGDGALDDVIFQIRDRSAAFFTIYMENLCTFLGMKGDTEDAEYALSKGLSHISSGNRLSRHFKAPMTAPWFWIESSGLLSSASRLNCPLAIAGYGPMAWSDSLITHPAIRGIVDHRSEGDFESWDVDWKGARLQAFVPLWRYKDDDGLALMWVDDPLHGFALPGTGPSQADRQEQRPPPREPEDMRQLDTHLWWSVSNGFPHPAEMTSFDTLSILSLVWGGRTGRPTPTCAPSIKQLLDQVIHVTCVSMSVCIEQGQGGGLAPEVVRDYTRACRVLSKARMYAGGRIGSRNARQVITDPVSVVGEFVPTARPEPITGRMPGGVTRPVTTASAQVRQTVIPAPKHVRPRAETVGRPEPVAATAGSEEQNPQTEGDVSSAHVEGDQPQSDQHTARLATANAQLERVANQAV